MEIFAHHSMHDTTRYIKTTGFSMPQFFMLMHVHRHERCGISDLSERMEVSAAAASQLADKLVQAGLLERNEDLHDRRAKHLTLTPKGQAFINASIAERYRWMEQVAENLSADERETVNQAMVILTKAAKQQEESLASNHE